MEKVRITKALEDIITFKFPNIKNLNIFSDDDFGMTITFEENGYSKEEVDDFLNQVREEIKKDVKNEVKTNCIINPIIETDFGFKASKNID